MKCNRYDTEISVKEFCLLHYSLVIWGTCQTKRMIRIVTFVNLRGNTLKWMFYPTKFSIKREKKCTQSSQVDGLVSFSLSPPPQAATILTLLETLVIQDGLNFQLFLIILLGGRVRVFSPCNTSLNIRSKCLIDICLQLI